MKKSYLGECNIGGNMLISYGTNDLPSVATASFPTDPDYSYNNAFWEVASDSKQSVKLGWLKASGKSLDYVDAALKCIGEAVERLTSSVYRDDMILFSTQTELERSGKLVLDLTRLPLFTESQISSLQPLFRSDLRNFTDSDKKEMIGWVEGETLFDRKKVYVPAQMVFLNYIGAAIAGLIRGARKEPIYSLASSSGIAAHPKFEEAIQNSLLELIERDSVMKTWITKRKPRAKVRPDDMEEMLGYPVEKGHYNLWLLDISALPKVPVFMSMLFSVKPRYPGFTCGAACDFPAEKAVEKSAVESLQSIEFLRLLKILGTKDVDIRKVTNFEDNVLFYARPEAREYIAFLMSYEKEEALGDLKDRYVQSYDQLETTLCKLGCSPIIVDLSNEICESFGLKVVKAIEPNFIPLMPPAILPLAHPALDSLCKFEDRNSFPHPFP